MSYDPGDNLPYDDSADGYESVTCTSCNGSGEGQYEGTRCRACQGSGVKWVEREDDDE